MKKNITINLFGTLYAIDEDAYELLNRYLSDMKEYFSGKEGGEEIADDIEHRAAELMQELKSQGVEAVTIEHVKSIIKRIGSPEEMENDSASADNSQESEHKESAWFTKNFKQKKLFRDVNNQMLGGVISGLACYLGIDVTLLRLLAVLLACLSAGSVTLVYLILWIVIPAAVTPEERLHMQGRSINMENLRDEIINGAKRTGEFVKSPETKNVASGCLNKILSLLVLLIKVFFTVILVGIIVVCGLFLVGLLIVLAIWGFGLLSGSFSIMGLHATDLFIINEFTSNEVYWIAGLSLFVSLILIIYLCVHAILRQNGRVKPLGPSLIVYVIGLIISIVVFVASTVNGTVSYQHFERNYREECAARQDSMQLQEDLRKLSSAGWKVVKHENCGNVYFAQGEYYSGSRYVRYIDSYSDNPNMEYTVERIVKVTPGVYRLEAAARTDGDGPEIYAYSNQVRYSASIPNNGNRGGDIWQQAVDGYAKAKDDKRLKKMAKVNNGKGYGWSTVVVDNIEVSDSVLCYGVSNRSSAGEWCGSWFSATDFKLHKIK